MNFVALDFETADPMRDSACAVALVRVEGRSVTARETRLIRPPRREFWFTHIHGITWEHVRYEPDFGDLWPTLGHMLEGVDFIAAHNAPFDRSVIRACCARAGLEEPDRPWLCTVRLARKIWDIHPTRLPNVCERLAIPLRHHEAASDAEACAAIVLRGALNGGRKVVGEMIAAG